MSYLILIVDSGDCSSSSNSCISCCGWIASRCPRLSWSSLSLIPILISARIFSPSFSGTRSCISRSRSSIPWSSWRRRSIVLSRSPSVGRVIGIWTGTSWPLSSGFLLHSLLTTLSSGTKAKKRLFVDVECFRFWNVHQHAAVGHRPSKLLPVCPGTTQKISRTQIVFHE